MSNDPRKFKTGIAVTGTATVGGDNITTNSASQTLVNKTIDADLNTVSNIDNADIKSGAAIDATKIADGSVSNVEFQYLDGVTSGIQSQLNNKADAADLADYILLTEKGANNGVATLDAGGKIPVAQLPNSVMEYKGTWNASTNTPTLVDGTGNAGDVYLVSVAGTQNLGSGSITFDVGDWVVYSGSVWQKSINSNAVVSVNGQTGVVTLTTSDVAEGSNLYFTDERAQDAVGTILTDSSKIDFTYNDAGNTITATIVPASLVDADINASAAIDAAKIADGSVSNSEFQSLDGVTAPIQTQLDGKASTTLNNLGTTSINASLIPDSANRALGANSNTNLWRYLFGREVYLKNNGLLQFQDPSDNPLMDVKASSSSAISLPSGADTNVYLNSFNNTTNRRFAIFSPNDATANANPTDSINIESGNKSAGTGNSGSITFQTGTSTGGTRGDIILNGRQINASSTKIVNVTNPTSAQDAATKAYVDAAVSSGGSPGDIAQTSFSLANNQASPADVTGFAFANASVRSFDALVSVSVDATSDVFETFKLLGVQRGSDWSLSYDSTGDTSGVSFTITNAGQIQYTSSSYAGFVSGTIKFRAVVTNV